MTNDDTDNVQWLAGSALLAGLVMLAFGFFVGIEGVSQSVLYNSSVSAFNWVMRIGGLAMIGVALLGFLNWRPALVLDSACSIVIGLLMVTIGLIWLANNDQLDGILIVVFGGIFIRSAIMNWSMYCRSRVFGGAGHHEVPLAEKPAEPPTGESLAGLRSKLARPKPAEDTEPPPVTASQSEPPAPNSPTTPDHPDGFLADLGRDDDPENKS